ncbi:mitochondrial matrix protein frataxin [Plasmopara halstedii]|uniref:Mitochondrial matrix protein frataxin n=1 Tax=Plasmopara halstedii TaxID=4781 RepID=A0A0N7L4E5_PLAHL|nr:mitochondrial matrix protein frataxin [Plasmopara halstedii]CEG38451.1 mitochondrial matrix protein frataxin [Plasmopara halstedii]|eukprot:XP_024574820.1 mitochondrial matrix protein frataxin [Plasmopara halstedii]
MMLQRALHSTRNCRNVIFQIYNNVTHVAMINCSVLHLVQTRGKLTVPIANRRRRLKSKISKDKFAALSLEFLDRVQNAMEPLYPPINDEFQLKRDDGEIYIRTNAREFVVKVLHSKQQIEFSSPVSGLRSYQWNVLTKRWEDEADSHDIEGLLTRDLMRFCVGIPRF